MRTRKPLYAPRLFRAVLFAIVASGFVAADTSASTLQLGSPSVAGDVYTFPIALQQPSGQVSSLNFRIEYDPEVFQPIEALPGTAALIADKQVAAHAPAPGTYNVVVMNLNQRVIQPGEVAAIRFQRVHTPANGRSRIRLTNPALSTPEGIEVAASGSNLRLDFDGGPSGGDSGPTDGGGNPSDPSTDPGPADATPPADIAPAEPSGQIGGLTLAASASGVASARSEDGASIDTGSDAEADRGEDRGPGSNRGTDADRVAALTAEAARAVDALANDDAQTASRRSSTAPPGAGDTASETDSASTQREDRLRVAAAATGVDATLSSGKGPAAASSGLWSQGIPLIYLPMAITVVVMLLAPVAVYSVLKRRT